MIATVCARTQCSSWPWDGYRRAGMRPAGNDVLHAQIRILVDRGPVAPPSPSRNLQPRHNQDRDRYRERRHKPARVPRYESPVPVTSDYRGE
jgi:hypothetical protein